MGIDFSTLLPNAIEQLLDGSQVGSISLGKLLELPLRILHVLK